MYLKVPEGNELFDQLTIINQKMVDAQNKAFDFVKEMGGISWFENPWKLAGGIAGICFDKQPANWRKVCDGKAYAPYRNRKAVQQVRKQIEQLPVVEYEELNNVLNFTERFVGRKRFSRPRLIIWGEDCILFEIQDEYVDNGGYQPPPQAIEITKTMFNQIRDAIYQQQERNNHNDT